MPRSEAAAVAVAPLDAEALLEPVHLDPQLGELTPAEAVAAGAVEPVADLVRLTAQAEGLAGRDHAPAGRAVDPLPNLVEPDQQLLDGTAIRAAIVPAAVVALVPLAVVAAILGGSRNSGQRGGRDGDGNKQFTHYPTPLAARLLDCF